MQKESVFYLVICCYLRSSLKRSFPPTKRLNQSMIYCTCTWYIMQPTYIHRPICTCYNFAHWQCLKLGQCIRPLHVPGLCGCECFPIIQIILLCCHKTYCYVPPVKQAYALTTDRCMDSSFMFTKMLYECCNLQIAPRGPLMGTSSCDITSFYRKLTTQQPNCVFLWFNSGRLLKDLLHAMCSNHDFNGNKNHSTGTSASLHELLVS